MSDENAEKARWNAEKRLDQQYQASLADYAGAGYESPVTEWETNFWEAGFKRGVSVGVEAGRASRDAEVAALENAVFANEHGCESAESEAEAERTRADKAEAVMTAIVNATSGTGDGPTGEEMLAGVTDALTMTAVVRARQRISDMEAEVARLREVIERAKEYPDLPKGLWNLLDLAAVPVEPQTDHEGSQR